MDITEIDLVRSTFAAVVPTADAFSTTFYKHLFELEPDLRAMFPDDLVAQRNKLIDELLMIVDCLGRLPALAARTTELGRRHVDYGVEPHHYDLVLDALLFALDEQLAEAMTPEATKAWRHAYHLIAETMLYGAHHPV